MYDLDRAKIDYPWTLMKGDGIEPWLELGWFDDMPDGWGDIINYYLGKIDKILATYGARDKIVIQQVKEKWGRCRVYFVIFADDGVPVGCDSELYKKVEEQFDELEDVSSRVCCFCGTRENVNGHGGWYHYACDSCEKDIDNC